MMSTNKQDTAQLVDTEELSRRINLTPVQIGRYRRRGLIPCIRLSRKMIRYSVSDVQAAILKLREPERTP